MCGNKQNNVQSDPSAALPALMENVHLRSGSGSMQEHVISSAFVFSSVLVRALVLTGVMLKAQGNYCRISARVGHKSHREQTRSDNCEE